MTTKPSPIIGRPTDYSEEIAAKICDLVSTYPYGLKRLTQVFPELPVESTINLWRLKHESFSVAYYKAKLIQAGLIAEECLDIADDVAQDYIESEDGNTKCNTEFVNRSRLRVDTRKWLAGKLLPKLYGDAKQVEELQSDNERYRKELAELRDQLDAKHKKEY